MTKTQRVLALFLIMAILTPLLYACSNSTPSTAQNYLRLWEARDYTAMYELLSASAAAKISQEEFVDKYVNIYDGIGLTALTLVAGEVSEDTFGNRMLPVNVQYQGERFGTMDLTFTLPLVEERTGWKVDWSPALIFPNLDWNEKVRATAVYGRRGEIFDKNNELIGQNIYAPTVYANPSKIGDTAVFAAALSPLIEMPAQDILKKLEGKSGQDTLVAIKVYDIGALAEETKAAVAQIPGAGVDESSLSLIRYYPFGKSACHLIGYTGVITADELEKKDPDDGYTDTSIVGKSGLEAAYESVLRGKRGYQIYIEYESGGKKEILYEEPAENGQDLWLSLDIKTQQEAERLLTAQLSAGMRGSVIVMDTKTGFVEAMASYPGYDLNLFRSMDQETWDELNDPDGGRPLYNRCTSGLYAPGSTIKPFTASLALEMGKITPTFVFPQKIVNNQWTPIFNGVEWGPPPIYRYKAYSGDVNLRNALIHSDNIYFAYAALMCGEDAFNSYASRLGLGEAIEFDLGTATSQLHSDPEAGFPSARILADAGYGQGEMLITPIQMASTFAALGNDGNIPRPRVVQSYGQAGEGIADYTMTETFEPSVWKSGVVSAENLSLLVPILRAVVTEGTGRSVDVEGMGVAAKTGTAQLGMQREKLINWIIAFATEGDNHRLVCTTLETKSGEGDNERMVITRDLLKFSH